MPYNINVDYELKTYKHVGRDYCKDKRKKQRKKPYKVCNTYIEWKTHIQSLLPEDDTNIENMLHWLYRRRNYQRNFVQAIEIILIPIYICLIQIVDSSMFSSLQGNEKFILFLMILLVIVFFSTRVLSINMSKLDFYNDIIEITEDKKQQNASHQ